MTSKAMPPTTPPTISPVLLLDVEPLACSASFVVAGEVVIESVVSVDTELSKVL